MHAGYGGSVKKVMSMPMGSYQGKLHRQSDIWADYSTVLKVLPSRGRETGGGWGMDLWVQGAA